MTPWALLAVTTAHVQLAFQHSAIVAGMLPGAPIVRLGTVRDALKGNTIDHHLPNALGRLDALGPALDHADAAIHDKAVP